MSRQTDRCVNKKKEYLSHRTKKTHFCLRRSVPARGCNHRQHQMLLHHCPGALEEVEGASSCIWRCSIQQHPNHPCICPKMLQASPDANALQINRHRPGHRVFELVLLERLGVAGEAGTVGRANFASSLQARPLQPLSSLVPGGTKPKQYLFTEERGEK